MSLKNRAFFCGILLTTTLFAQESNVLENLRNYRGHINGTSTGQRVLEDGSVISEPKGLYPEQVPIYETIKEHYLSGKKEGYVVAPTGTGKTVIFSKFAEAIVGQSGKALIVVPNIDLIHQVHEEVLEFTNYKPKDVGTYYTGSKQLDRQITITTYNSFVNLMKSNAIDPHSYDLLVLDEVHRGLSDLRAGEIAKFDHALRIGFTATPEFNEEKQVDNILHQRILKITIREAIEKGILSPMKTVGLQFDIDLAEAEKNGDYDEKTLDKLLRQGKIIGPAIEAYREFVQLTGSQQAVIYCNGIAHSEEVAKAFNQAGIPTIAIHSGNSEYQALTAKERKHVLDDFRKGNGKYQVLTNPNVLIEGFDAPETGLIINLRPILSKVVAEQRGGRGARKSKKNPDKVGFVIEFIYKNSKRDKNGKPIQKLYSDILQGAEAYSQQTKEGHGKIINPYEGNRSKMEQSLRKITDLYPQAVEIVSTEELASIGIGKKTVKLQITTQDQLKTLIEKHNQEHPTEPIKNRQYYADIAAKYDYPNFSNLYKNIPGDIDWRYVFGRQQQIQITTQEELKSLIEKYNREHPIEPIRNSNDYSKLASRYDYPSVAALRKTIPGDIDWRYVCGREKQIQINTQEELKSLIEKHNQEHPNETIKFAQDYMKLSGKYDYPSFPNLYKTIPGKIDWEYVCSMQKRLQITTQDQLKTLIEKHNQEHPDKTIKSKDAYRDLAREYGYPDIVNLENSIPGDVDWNYVCEKNKIKQQEKDLKALIEKHNQEHFKDAIKTSSDYATLAAKYGYPSASTIRSNIPGGIIDWQYVFGRKQQIQIVTQEQLKTLIEKHNQEHPNETIKSSEDYRKLSAKYDYPGVTTLNRKISSGFSWKYVCGTQQQIVTQEQLKTLIEKHNQEHPNETIKSGEDYRKLSTKYAYPSASTLGRSILGGFSWSYVFGSSQIGKSGTLGAFGTVEAWSGVRDLGVSGAKAVNSTAQQFAQNNPKTTGYTKEFGKFMGAKWLGEILQISADPGVEIQDMMELICIKGFGNYMADEGEHYAIFAGGAVVANMLYDAVFQKLSQKYERVATMKLVGQGVEKTVAQRTVHRQLGFFAGSLLLAMARNPNQNFKDQLSETMISQVGFMGVDYVLHGTLKAGTKAIETHLRAQKMQKVVKIAQNIRRGVEFNTGIAGFLVLTADMALTDPAISLVTRQIEAGKFENALIQSRNESITYLEGKPTQTKNVQALMEHLRAIQNISYRSVMESYQEALEEQKAYDQQLLAVYDQDRNIMARKAVVTPVYKQTSQDIYDHYREVSGKKLVSIRESNPSDINILRAIQAWDQSYKKFQDNCIEVAQPECPALLLTLENQRQSWNRLTADYQDRGIEARRKTFNELSKYPLPSSGMVDGSAGMLLPMKYDRKIYQQMMLKMYLDLTTAKPTTPEKQFEQAIMAHQVFKAIREEVSNQYDPRDDLESRMRQQQSGGYAFMGEANYTTNSPIKDSIYLIPAGENLQKTMDMEWLQLSFMQKCAGVPSPLQTYVDYNQGFKQKHQALLNRLHAKVEAGRKNQQTKKAFTEANENNPYHWSTGKILHTQSNVDYAHEKSENSRTQPNLEFNQIVNIQRMSEVPLVTYVASSDIATTSPIYQTYIQCQ